MAKYEAVDETTVRKSIGGVHCATMHYDPERGTWRYEYSKVRLSIEESDACECARAAFLAFEKLAPKVRRTPVRRKASSERVSEKLAAWG